jgi:hypothetical protein
MTLKLGIIGLSEGNGHPYSWSAIFNGYNPEAMEDCGYPVIPRYLEQQKWPESEIPKAEVISVWTQDAKQSEKVSQASLIKNVVMRPEDMVGQIDALLLARDDAENHLKFAEPFLKAGIPIYIDKPIALSMQDFEKIYSLEQYAGQIFTCSALRFSNELKLTNEDRTQLGEIRQIIACTPKSWNKYGVHIIEPVLNMLPAGDSAQSYTCIKSASADSAGTLAVNWNSGIQTTLFATGDGMHPISIRVVGTKGWKELAFSDSFSAFKAALEAFLLGIKSGTAESPRAFNAQVVQILEKGRT